MKSIRLAATLMLPACAVIAIACGGGADSAADSSTAAPAAQGMTGPRVVITSPAEGDTVAGDSVAIAMTVEGGPKLVPAAAARIEGEGHLHLYLDIPVSRLDVPIPVDPPAVTHIGTGASTFKYALLPAGPHRIIAVYAYGDHTIDPKVAMDTLNIVVK